MVEVTEMTTPDAVVEIGAITVQKEHGCDASGP